MSAKRCDFQLRVSIVRDESARRARRWKSASSINQFGLRQILFFYSRSIIDPSTEGAQAFTREREREFIRDFQRGEYFSPRPRGLPLDYVERVPRNEGQGHIRELMAGCSRIDPESINAEKTWSGRTRSCVDDSASED